MAPLGTGGPSPTAQAGCCQCTAQGEGRGTKLKQRHVGEDSHPLLPQAWQPKAAPQWVGLPTSELPERSSSTLLGHIISPIQEIFFEFGIFNI